MHLIIVCLSLKVLVMMWLKMTFASLENFLKFWLVMSTLKKKIKNTLTFGIVILCSLLTVCSPVFAEQIEADTELGEECSSDTDFEEVSLYSISTQAVVTVAPSYYYYIDSYLGQLSPQQAFYVWYYLGTWEQQSWVGSLRSIVQLHNGALVFGFNTVLDSVGSIYVPDTYINDGTGYLIYLPNNSDDVNLKMLENVGIRVNSSGSNVVGVSINGHYLNNKEIAFVLFMDFSLGGYNFGGSGDTVVQSFDSINAALNSWYFSRSLEMTSENDLNAIVKNIQNNTDSMNEAIINGDSSTSSVVDNYETTISEVIEKDEKINSSLSDYQSDIKEYVNDVINDKPDLSNLTNSFQFITLQFDKLYEFEFVKIIVWFGTAVLLLKILLRKK